MSVRDSLVFNEFNYEYNKGDYYKFEGEIFKNKNCYTFDKQYICGDETREINILLSSGIINPKMLTTYHIDKFFIDNPELEKTDFLLKFKDELKSFEKDTIGISNLEVLEFFNLNIQRKRFSFWYRDDVFASPLIYFMELENKSATKNMKLVDFIKNSKLTFIRQGWFE